VDLVGTKLHVHAWSVRHRRLRVVLSYTYSARSLARACLMHHRCVGACVMIQSACHPSDDRSILLRTLIIIMHACMHVTAAAAAAAAAIYNQGSELSKLLLQSIREVRGLLRAAVCYVCIYVLGLHAMHASCSAPTATYICTVTDNRKDIAKTILRVCDIYS